MALKGKYVQWGPTGKGWAMDTPKGTAAKIKRSGGIKKKNGTMDYSKAIKDLR